MNSVIVYQGGDSKIEAVLKPLTDLGPNTQPVGSTGESVYTQFLHPWSPRGPVDMGGMLGFAAIVDFAWDLLSGTQADLVEMQVIFIFHQTNEQAVRGITQTMELVRDTNILHYLTQKHSKRLDVNIVNLLSCETATDKAVSPPIATVVQKWVDQASQMRALAKRAFIVPKSPPPEPGNYHPRVVTYTTGDPETGGVVLNPFAVSFQKLHGHFTASGGWQYDNPQAPLIEPTEGTIHTSFEGTDTTQPLPSGTSINVLGFPPP